MIYFSFIGNHDKMDSGQFGAAITIFSRYKDEIDKVYLLVSPNKPEGPDFELIANQNKMFMEGEGASVEIVPFDLENPVDYDLVYPKLLDTVQIIIEKNNLQETEKVINISSGTPTMTTCWVLLQQSGLIAKAKLVQSFENRFAKVRGTSSQEVNLGIDDFPQITAPDAIKRELTIKNRVNEQLSQKVKQSEIDEKFPNLIGKSKKIREYKELISEEIDKDTHILITGERGTGKEVVAEAIKLQMLGSKADEKFHIFNCGGSTPTLIVSALFGHRKGAFTGATEDKIGLLEQADGGIIFLDEIGNLPKEGQESLLRFLQSGEVQPLGGTGKPKKVKVQVIVATNKNINDSTLFAQDVKDRFDERIELPPLRERKEDIPLLVNHFINRHSDHPFVLKKEIMDQIIAYRWDGNIRELEKWIKKLIRWYSMDENRSLDDIPDRIIQQIMSEPDEDVILPDLPLSMPLKPDYINMIVEKARKMSGGNSAEVDRLLMQVDGTERNRLKRERDKQS